MARIALCDHCSSRSVRLLLKQFKDLRHNPCFINDMSIKVAASKLRGFRPDLVLVDPFFQIKNRGRPYREWWGFKILFDFLSGGRWCDQPDPQIVVWSKYVSETMLDYAQSEHGLPPDHCVKRGLTLTPDDLKRLISRFLRRTSRPRRTKRTLPTPGAPKQSAKVPPEERWERSTPPKSWDEVRVVLAGDEMANAWLEFWRWHGQNYRARHRLKRGRGAHEADFYWAMRNIQLNQPDGAPEMPLERLMREFMTPRNPSGAPQRESAQKRVHRWAKALEKLHLPARGVYIKGDTVYLAFPLDVHREERPPR